MKLNTHQHIVIWLALVAFFLRWFDEFYFNLFWILYGSIILFIVTFWFLYLLRKARKLLLLLYAAFLAFYLFVAFMGP